MRILLFFILLIVISGCGKFKADVDPVTGKKIRKEPNLMKRGDDFADEQGGIFNSNRSSKGGTTYDFATSNIIWRAALESLDFVPLQSANYSGGVLITDWYSNDINSNESIKIEIRFLSDKTSPSSLKIISYKKICINSNCKIAKLSDSFNEKLLTSIMSKVRELKVKDELNKKKKG
jgi:hypothetical protein|tara:strand:- start:315 stop:845 length:531 start_codon:yes stop_codon:yes gene_type:complete